MLPEGLLGVAVGGGADTHGGDAPRMVQSKDHRRHDDGGIIGMGGAQETQTG